MLDAARLCVAPRRGAVAAGNGGEDMPALFTYILHGRRPIFTTKR